MSKDPDSLSLYPNQHVLTELVADPRFLVLGSDIKLGGVIGIGGYAEVFKGTLMIAKTNRTKIVAVKRFRILLEKEKDFVKTFSRELLIWESLDHVNVLPLIGPLLINGSPALASEWMENGTITEYLKGNANVNVLQIVKGIACGMVYLHGCGIVHSDLKGDNVLISREGRPVLSDFGVSRLLINSKTIAGTTSLKGNTRWMAPELLTPEESPKHEFHTKATDVWAFGMVVYEVLSGKIPFENCRSEAQVLMSVISSKLPVKPEDGKAHRLHFDPLWECCCACWGHDPAERPRMTEVRERLNSLLTVETKLKLSGWGWMSPTGQFAATRYDDGMVASFLDTRTGNRCGPDLRLETEVCAIAWSSTAEHILTRTEDGILRKWSNVFESATVVAEATDEAVRLVLSPDDKLVVSSGEFAAKLRSASDLSLIWEYSGYWFSVAFHPMGHRLFLFHGSSVTDVKIEDFGNITATDHNLSYIVYEAVFDPSGNTLAARTTEGVKVLNVDSFEEKTSLPFSDVEAMRFTPDGMYLLLVVGTKEVVLWDIAAGYFIEQMILDMDSDCILSAEISKSCHVILLHDGLGATYTIHLASKCY